ncbi:hypothetical protein Pcinc_022440 [Petrolisthes cinctipes]|uniref:Uncharacterized protein n=1 Tax=Petrolisthes cinctipes TaxID=88211 RepID=A0AAE1KGR5_PETCI|nr:hypothetical protein Pcinc_022440 [Petrolisthes cinctipes]
MVSFVVMIGESGVVSLSSTFLTITHVQPLVHHSHSPSTTPNLPPPYPVLHHSFSPSTLSFTPPLPLSLHLILYSTTPPQHLYLYSAAPTLPNTSSFTPTLPLSLHLYL